MPTAVDEETPRRPVHVAALGTTGRVVDHPGTGIGFGAGFALGGEKLATVTFSNGSTDDLRAGEGFIADLEGAVTPLWSGDSVGFGAGGAVGVKYRSIDAANGSISLLRFPVLAFVQMLAPTGERGSFLLRVGVQRDLATHFGVSASGTEGGADLSSSNGFVGEVGAWYQMNAGAAMVVTVRFTSIHYAVGGSNVDATSGGLVLGVLFDPR
jgi:hypothetical protein